MQDIAYHAFFTVSVASQVQGLKVNNQQIML